jgi:Right handed beta helix region/Divergent InlB B-repeat domain
MRLSRNIQKIIGMQTLFKLTILAVFFGLAACGSGTAGSQLASKKGLNVTVAGNGSVSSLPSGFVCEGSCLGEFDSDRTVTLKAIAKQGAKFFGWGGACSDTVTSELCTVTLDQFKSVNASFTPAPSPLSCLPAMASSSVVNVRDYGAKGNGLSDDTSSIQLAIDAAAMSTGTAIIPDGLYLIDASISLRPKSNVTIRMTSNAILRARPNDRERYAVIFINGASNVNIVGGIIEGDRDAHLGTTGEWGMGIQLNGAKSVVIEGTMVRDAWGDGVYIGGSSSTGPSQKVSICGVVSDKNCRQGLSAVYVDGLIVKNSVFKNTSGTRPELGLDIEPNPGQSVRNVSITDSIFSGNAGGGVAIALDPANKLTASIESVIFKDNVVINSGRVNAPRLLAGVTIAGTQATTIRGNWFSDNIGAGISDVGSMETVIDSNRVIGTKYQSVKSPADGTGVSIMLGRKIVIRNNSIMINKGIAISIPDNSGVLLDGNLTLENEK